METATFANGCFWCTEAIFRRINGVNSVVSGYSGGKSENPTYEDVCKGNTGHAESIQVTFDPNVISFADLVDIFFKTHDPTTLNRQGNDEGTQYRSAIFYHDEKQMVIAKEYIEKLEKQNVYPDPIVTEVTKYTKFYPAESYHQDFYSENRNHPYCRIMIDPKIKKLIEEFKPKLK
jgi:peptide-methionine (S)-S-oxide reductase